MAILSENSTWSLAPMIAGATSFIGHRLIFHKRIFFIGDYESFLAGEAQLIVTTIVGISAFLFIALASGFVSLALKRFSESDPKFF